MVESLVGLPSSVFASGVSGTSSKSEVPQAVSSVAVTAQMVNSDVLKVPNVSFFQVIIVSFVFCEPCPFRVAGFVRVRSCPFSVWNDVFFTLCLSMGGSHANLPIYPYTA